VSDQTFDYSSGIERPTLMDPITSPANPRVKQAVALRAAGERRRTSLTLVDGLREITRAIVAGVEIVEIFVAADARADDARAADRATCLETCLARGAEVVRLGPRAFEKLAFGDRDEGMVAVVRFATPALPQVTFAADRPVLVAEAVEKPGNLGAILRTADAAGLAGVIICAGRTDAANPAVIRASLGTVFSVPLACGTTAAAIAACIASGRRVVAAMPEGRVAWHEADLTGAPVILLGSEAHGIDPAWQAAASGGRLRLDTVRLPMHGIADSLNVAATAAVLAYEHRRQLDARRSTVPPEHRAP